MENYDTAGVPWLFSLSQFYVFLIFISLMYVFYAVGDGYIKVLLMYFICSALIDTVGIAKQKNS